ncbi:MAG: molecular chaperone TorD family protein [Ramlibacter sp.]|nr:molecular chaperone TorD family protein [Ramlibacter sp.]
MEFDSEKAGAREDLCRFLAACYYEPDPAFEEERLFDSMLAAATRLDAELAASARRLGDAFAAQDLETLLVDYTRLFLGPPEALAKPYGSCWLGAEAALMQESTLAVMELYREGGFEVDEEFMELPDHIAAELEFLYLLVFKQNEAVRAGLPDVRADWAKLQGIFLAEHLGKWVTPFAAAVSAGAQTPFYRELAGLTQRFLGMETSAAPARAATGTGVPSSGADKAAP